MTPFDPFSCVDPTQPEVPWILKSSCSSLSATHSFLFIYLAFHSPFSSFPRWQKAPAFYFYHQELALP